MARRKKQEPGVFGPRKLADGRLAWDVRYRNDQGKHKSRTFYDLDEANRFAVEHRHGLIADEGDASMTLGQYFGQEIVWKTIRDERRLSETTADRWLEIWRNHLCHEEYGVSHKTLQQLQRKRTIDTFLIGMKEAGVGDPMRRRALGILSKILDHALHDDVILRNPIPAIENKPSAGRQRKIYIPPIHVIEMIRHELLNHPNRRRRTDYGQRDALMISLMAYQAPRPEELRRLTWRHAGLDSGFLHIIADKAYRGKSKTFQRNVPLNEVVAEELRQWYEVQGGPAPHMPVIPLPEWGKRRGGDRWTSENWKDWRNRIFKPALERAAQLVTEDPEERENICSMRPYDLRHTALSLWLANGGKNAKGEWDGSPANPVEVAGWGGHEVRTLWENYAHRVETAPKIPIAEQIKSARKAIGS